MYFGTQEKHKNAEPPCHRITIYPPEKYFTNDRELLASKRQLRNTKQIQITYANIQWIMGKNKYSGLLSGRQT